jgi:hypothetical protein
MREATNILKIIGLVFLTVFVVVVGGRLLMAAIGITLGIAGLIFTLAVFLIKLAVVIAIGYLILVGVRAVLR